jgi:branched-chain amino acid transport system substrate-binding protein
MTHPLKPLLFSGRGTYFDESRAIVSHFAKEYDADTPCVVYQDTDYGQEVFDGVEAQAEEMGLEIAAVSAHKPTDTEFTATILRLRNAKCDLVVLGTITRDTILILETAKKMGWDDAVFVGGNATYSNALAELPSGSAEGYQAFNHMATIYPEDDNSPQVEAWLGRWMERQGKIPEYGVLEGYRSLDVIIRALEAAGPNPTRKAVVDAIEAMDDYEDIFGYRLSFSPEDHSGVFESTLSIVRDGRWHKLAESITY